MGPIPSEALLHVRQQDGATRKQTLPVEYNWEAPWTSFNQAIPTGQRCCAFQPTEDSGDAIDATFYHRKGHVNVKKVMELRSALDAADAAG